MTEKPYFDQTQASMLRSWVLGQMLQGAGYAAAVLIVIAFVLCAIWGVGLLLPEDSKTAPDPSLGPSLGELNASAQAG